ncbi:hypothetical protein ZWY2020_027871 [Hordeum vulgare]|nr:hypothetical protein ZWY2020_027871 [Hordeum vulgare]
MSDGADSDRDLPRTDGDDEPRHADPRAAKEEEPPVADEFQDAPRPRNEQRRRRRALPDRAGLPNAGERGEAAPPDAGEEAVGVRVETNGEDAMSHDGDEGDGEDEDDDEDDDDEEDDEDEDDDSTPDASPRAEVKTVGDGSTGMAQCASQQPVEPDPFLDGHDSGTEEEQAAFMSELDRFHRSIASSSSCPSSTARASTASRPALTVSWSFRIFYEKALLEYEKHKVRTGQLKISIPAIPQPGGTNREGINPSSSARIRRDAAARAMQGWHAHRLLANDMYGDHIFKDKDSIPLSSRDKNLKGFGVLKRKKASSPERAFKVSRTKVNKSQEDSMVIDVGEPADWVKINVRQTKECFEIYALVPGLLREEVHVQSDPAGRLVITGDPDQPDNPWGITAFKKVINLPLRIDPHQTSAVVTLHGQLFVLFFMDIYRF